MAEDMQPPTMVTPMVTVVITVDHVYLPLNADGSARTAWKDVEETTKVAKRTRLTVPADLAEELSKRDQAEIVSAPLPSTALGTGEAGL
jgi:hypothetical protein